MAPRFLSASKLCLLALARLYQEGCVPGKAVSSVLTLIASHIQPEVSLLQNTAKSTGCAVGGFLLLQFDAFQVALAPYSTTVANEHGTFQTVSLWRLFQRYVHSIKDMDVMTALVSDVETLFFAEDGCEVSTEDNQFSATSPLGLFIRRAKIELELLRFPEATQLWRDFEIYTRRGFSSDSEDRSKETPFPFEGTSIDDAEGAFGYGWAPEMMANFSQQRQRSEKVVSAHDCERLVEFQIGQMQKYGGLLSAEMKQQLEVLAFKDQSLPAQWHYARFLETWYNGQQEVAFESLHRFYDYAMQARDKSQYQYALLNMAIVHAEFGSYGEAVMAMNETIATARENKDKVCLQYCLTWLHTFRAMSHGKIGQDDATSLGANGNNLNLLRAGARQEKLWAIEAATLLNEVNDCVMKGRAPEEALERLTEASYLILHHRLARYKTTALMARGMIFSRMGQATLAMSYYIHASARYDSSVDDCVNARSKIAHMHVIAGRYTIALKILADSQDLANRNFRSRQYLAHSIGIVKLRKALHTCDLATSERIINALKAGCSGAPELVFNAALLEVEYLSMTENFADAFTLVEALLDQNLKSETEDVFRHIRCLQAKATLLVKANRPQRGFSLVLRAITAARRSHNYHALWEVVSTYVSILNGLGEYDEAFRVAENTVCEAIETDDACLMARLWSAGADSLIGLVLTSKMTARVGAQDDPAIFSKAVSWLKSSLAEHQKTQDILGQSEVWQKLAIVSRAMGREEAACGFDLEAGRMRALISSKQEGCVRALISSKHPSAQ